MCKRVENCDCKKEKVVKVWSVRITMWKRLAQFNSRDVNEAEEEVERFVSSLVIKINKYSLKLQKLSERREFARLKKTREFSLTCEINNHDRIK